MHLPFSQEEWKKILGNVYKRAASDHQFHTLCQRDAHAAIKQVSGRDVPKSFKIRFVDESEELCIMLPSEKRHAATPLTDTQLEELAEKMVGTALFDLQELPTSGH